MIKRISMIATVLSLLVFSGGAISQPIAGGMKPGEGNAKAGKTKSELCHGCHGVDGISIDPTTYPNLAGQYAGYIFKQVQDFQLGNRHDDTMSAMAATVTSLDDLKDIAVYFSSQKIMSGKSGNSKKSSAGKNLFEKGNPKAGVYGCVNCHGKNGKGKSKANSLFPIIGGQQKAYIIKQLNNFKTGTRKNDPAGMMGDIAKKLSKNDIENVAEFLSGM
ncbi:MAG: c-type cytochrome [Gammaproteobacteria bacterium]|nr:c-type cytochrome [Gammaproteobacteria bacterium]MDH5799844.1 c-type cytochrome [Gammaproteobacteria bacterium]